MIISGGSGFLAGYNPIPPLMSATLPPVTPPDPNTTPSTGELRRQYGWPTWAGPTWLRPNVNAVNVRCTGAVFQYTGQGIVHPPRGDYGTYRLMDLNPTLTVCWHLLTEPIVANTWSYEGVDEDTPQAWIDLVRRQVSRLRAPVVPETLRSLRMGWRGGEKVWEYENNEFVLKKLVAWDPEFAKIHVDQYGNFAGLSRAGSTDVLPPSKVWLVTNDREGKYFYGRSRHEGAYDAWCDWQQARIDAALTRQKISGIIPILYYPAGSTVIDGKEKPNADVARDILDHLALRNGVAMLNLTAAADDVANIPDLAGASMWKLDWYDAGNLGPAVESVIREREYNDKLLFRGWGLPERIGLEATTAGSRADAEQQSDNSANAGELIEDAITEQLSFGGDGVQGIADDILRYNVGEEAVGKVRIKPAPQNEEKAKRFQNLLDQLLIDPAFRRQFVRSIGPAGMRQILESQDFKVAGDFNVEAYAAAAESETQTDKPKPGNPVPSNGNGNTGGRF